MAQKEKRILVSTLATLVILLVYSLIVYNRYMVPDPALVHNTGFWAKAFLLLIPVMMVAQIIIHIIFAIVSKIITNEEIPTITDEMDKLIELKAMRVSHWIFILGIVLAMGSQAIGMAPWILFATLAGSMFLACIVEGIVQIWFYRKGV